jgi:hypothetical protein
MNQLAPIIPANRLPTLITAAGERAGLRFWHSSRPTSATRIRGAPIRERWPNS